MVGDGCLTASNLPRQRQQQLIHHVCHLLLASCDCCCCCYTGGFNADMVVQNTSSRSDAFACVICTASHAGGPRLQRAARSGGCYVCHDARTPVVHPDAWDAPKDRQRRVERRLLQGQRLDRPCGPSQAATKDCTIGLRDQTAPLQCFSIRRRHQDVRGESRYWWRR